MTQANWKINIFAFVITSYVKKKNMNGNGDWNKQKIHRIHPYWLKMHLLDILSTSSHYFCKTWIGATNENSNVDLRDWTVKGNNFNRYFELFRPCCSLFVSRRVKTISQFYTCSLSVCRFIFFNHFWKFQRLPTGHVTDWNILSLSTEGALMSNRWEDLWNGLKLG